MAVRKIRVLSLGLLASTAMGAPAWRRMRPSDHAPFHGKSDAASAGPKITPEGHTLSQPRQQNGPFVATTVSSVQGSPMSVTSPLAAMIASRSRWAPSSRRSLPP